MALEERFDDAYGNGCDESVAHVLYIVVLAEILLDGAGNVLFEGTLVRTALGGVLAVDKGVILLAILRGVGKGNVDVGPGEVDNGVEARGGHVVVEQVLQTVAADDAPSVVENGQSRVEVGVVSQQIFHKFRVETVVDEELLVGLEEDVGAVFLVSGAFGVADEYPLFEGGFAHFSVAYAAGHESHRERIDGFQTHPVHTHRGSEYGSVVLTARVELRNRVDQCTEGNAASVVADFGAKVVVDVYFDAFTVAFVEFVDAVVDAFLEQHVDAVFGVRTIAQSANVHARSGAYVLRVFEVSDFAFVVNHFGFGLRLEVIFGHLYR